MLNTFYDLLRVEYASLDKQLHGEIRAIEHQAAARGTLVSGGTIQLACEAGAVSLTARCRQAWEQLSRTMTANGIEIDRESGQLFLSEVGSQAENSSIAVKAIVKGCAVFRSELPANAMQAGMDIIEKALQHEFARAKAEVQLLIAASENMKPTAHQPGITINGDGNVLNTGNGNQINVATTIDTNAATALANALKASLDHLAVLPAGTPVDADEIKELVEDALAEVQKPKPNKIKIASVIKGFAEAIKFVPELKAAYNVIKPAAAVAGIYFP
ncbi:hypothetical protein [Rhizobium sp. JAB6]|uniref:hypothetical protein n=1 Tax=Rhizobium sp. JAB6 TaxID=2127050 RepID=UPI0011B20AB8|nr:hypothetical protein [Rhizobium sp. JAB6]